MANDVYGTAEGLLGLHHGWLASVADRSLLSTTRCSRSQPGLLGYPVVRIAVPYYACTGAANSMTPAGLACYYR